MTTSERGRRLIENFEGLRLKAYKDAVGVWTIGYGHTGPEVVEGLEITQKDADNILTRDLLRFELAVATWVKAPLNQNQFDALVSFSFNVGTGALKMSTLLRKLNAKDYKGAALEFLRWVFGNPSKPPLEGLKKRRSAEKALFEEPILSA